MMTLILVAAAAVLLLGGSDVKARIAKAWASVPKPELSWQQLAAVALLIGAVVAFNWQQPVVPGPTPPAPPAPPAALNLRGLFQGITAAEDAALVSALTGELADEIAWDGTLEKPLLTTGVAIDELRRRARELRCRGVSIGARQPAARDAIAKHLDAAVGNSGGPIDEAKRIAWVKALGEISEAAADVTR
jgi:hypothetical protein